MLSLEKLIERSGKLGSLPAIVYKVFAVMDESHSTATKIGKVINDDPALTARLLKLVNSPFYGFTAKVDTVYRAVALIGHEELRSVVIAASAINVFNGIPAELVSMKDFWKRSLAVAVTARVLAAFKREKTIERFFIAGLLHDIGSLLMYLKLPEEMAQVLQQETSNGIERARTEKEIIGYEHTEVGGGLLKKWNLPPQICASVRYQLEPGKAPEKEQESAWLLCLANEIVDKHFDLETGSELEEIAGEIDITVWQQNKLDPSLLSTILEKVQQQFESSKDVLIS
ncbi:MAG: signal transduction protein [endosymbiont of Galathealinum brachiosum]|uniref:Signal transduction protein n=1 Tax=endosymbiont of Galathealinum brachiosum TaxID=2200906 RepID=A0A370DDY1_9GAMM|nr:MAG: signal transduction protein [endosymbiont of Galathealinum brachiosum]